MTNEHARLICEGYLSMFDEIGVQPERNKYSSQLPRFRQKERILRHIAWMCQHTIELIDEGASEGKIGRWIGFVQGVMFMLDLFDILDLRRHNRDVEGAKSIEAGG